MLRLHLYACGASSLKTLPLPLLSLYARALDDLLPAIDMDTLFCVCLSILACMHDSGVRRGGEGRANNV